jgi:hypothetical protein
MKDDGRLKSLGILAAMIGVIVVFFAMFQRRPDEPLVTPVATSARPKPASSAPVSPNVSGSASAAAASSSVGALNSPAPAAR